MHKTRISAAIAGAITVVALTALPAAATYYITGWQGTPGWNSIDGCKVWHQVDDPNNNDDAYAIDYFCSRDVGVRAMGKTKKGTAERGTVTWDSVNAEQSPDPNGIYLFTAVKVYHGDH